MDRRSPDRSIWITLFERTFFRIHFFRGHAAHFPPGHLIAVALPYTPADIDTLSVAPGVFNAVSPEEFRIAFLVHVAEDMRQSPATATDWLPVLLSIPAEFHLEHDVANYLLENRQNREDFKQAGISLRRSPFEEVFEINAVKQQLEITTGCKQNGHAVAVAYSSVQLSTESDPHHQNLRGG